MYKLGLISTFLPTQCGIATYSHDLIQSLSIISSQIHFLQIELVSYPTCSNGKNYILSTTDEESFLKAANFINASDIDIIDIQHEFKIYGKPDGENILLLLENIRKPIVTTLHTVFSEMNEQREKVFRKIVERSDILYVFSNEAKDHIVNKYKKNRSCIEIIAHGVPLIKFKKPYQTNVRTNFSKPITFVSAGHMRNTKGYEVAIVALHLLKKVIPDFKYFILGSNHPQNETAQAYRETLLELINDLKLANNIHFIGSYLEQKELIKNIQLADIGLLPYSRKDQSSSGVLALMIACGRPVVSTPFQFAKSYVAKESGVLANSFHTSDFEQALKILIEKRDDWEKMSLYNSILGKKWNWLNIAHKYDDGYRTLTRRKPKSSFV